MSISTNQILSSIYTDFANTYKNAAPFVNSGALWDFCITTLSNPISVSCIIFANDLEVPPVKSLLQLYKKNVQPVDTFQFTAQESQWLGSLMGYVFKYVLGYQDQKERIQVKQYGVKTATRFYNPKSVIDIV